MPDVLIPTQRHRRMSWICSKATKLEMAVGDGYGYTIPVQAEKLDIVMRLYRTTIL